MDGTSPGGRPRLLIVAALVLLGLLVYTLFGAYLPSRQRVAGLEAELTDVYQKEAELQTQLAQSLQRNAALQQQLAALTAERETLIRHAEELEQTLRKRSARGR
jgi:septal ring factor EnvC (AmiA/AmiB activator)